MPEGDPHAQPQQDQGDGGDQELNDAAPGAGQPVSLQTGGKAARIAVGCGPVAASGTPSIGGDEVGDDVTVP
jgi:hypothetical protein